MSPLRSVGKATAVAKKTKKKKSTKKAVALRTKAKAKTAKKKTTKKKAVTRKTAKKKVQKKTAKKKTAVKKAAMKTAVKKKVAKKKKRPSKLTKKEIGVFRQLLLEKRAELVGDVNYIENETLRKSRGEAAGDLSSMPIHMADIGTDNFEQEFSLGLMDGERKILKEITAALQRIDGGAFGICEGTGIPISKPRLKAKPWARYGIKYATMVEQGLVIEGEKMLEEEFDEEEATSLEGSGEFDAIDDDGHGEQHNDPEDTQYGIFSTRNDD